MTRREDIPLREMPRIIFEVVGSEVGALKKALWLQGLSSFLRGVAFVMFIPFFRSVIEGDGKGMALYFGLFLLAMLLSSATMYKGYDFDFHGHATLAGNLLRHRLGTKLRSMPLADLSSRRTGEMLESFGVRIDELVNYTSMVGAALLNAVVLPFTVSIGVLFYHPVMGLAMLLIFSLFAPIYFKVRPVLIDGKKLTIRAGEHLKAESLEYFQGLQVLRVANAENRQESRLDDAIDGCESAQKEAMRKQTPPNLLLGASIELGAFVVVALGLYLADLATLDAVTVCAALVAMVRFNEPLSTFISYMNIFEGTLNSFSILHKLFSIEDLEIREPRTKPERFDVEFKNVSFKYEENESFGIENVSLRIPEKSLCALVGPSGCGKTTLTRLLTRFRDPDQGEVLVGGKDVGSMSMEDLMGQVAMVFQDVYLFDDSIMENIRLGREGASDEEVMEAAKMAMCHDFIMNLPKGYDTKVGEIGGALSGGEKQRISIARAFLKNAHIVVLDEPTSSLDIFSERAVQRAIDGLLKDKTVLVVAHRLSTIMAADNIVVMDDGRIVESGTHEELLDRKGAYWRLWHAKDELAA